MAKANEFQNEIGILLKQRFDVAYRLDDTSSNRFGNFQVSKKAFDYFGADSKGRFWGAEVKRTKSIRFPTINLAKHQRSSLISLEDNFCHAWLFINWRVVRSGVALWIPFNNYAETEYIAICNKRKSLKPTDFDSKWFLNRVHSKWVVPETHPLFGV